MAADGRGYWYEGTSAGKTETDTMKKLCMHEIDDCMKYKNNVNKMYPNCRKTLFSNGDIHSTIQIRIQEEIVWIFQIFMMPRKY